jgi:hypothetical protein
MPSADRALGVIVQEVRAAQRGGIWYVPMTTLMMPMRRAQDVPYQFCACVAMKAIDTQLTTAMVPLTAGLVASLKQISKWGCIDENCSFVI